jgi:multidrug efflux system membrane fusion protein
MALTDEEERRRLLGRIISIAAMIGAAVSCLLVLRQVEVNPRTDDAEIFANYIGMAPVVNGPIMHLYVADNQLVKEGQPLLDIDERPYAYALAHAMSDQDALAGEIGDERRIIAGKESGVDVAKASALSAEASLARAAAAIEQAKADVGNAQAAIERADAEQLYATDNLHRIEPLLAKQFVTVDQVDQARTLVVTRSQAANQARAQLALAQAGLTAADAQYKQSQAILDQSHQQVQQATHNVTTLEPLEGQLTGKQAAINTAKYNLDTASSPRPLTRA